MALVMSSDDSLILTNFNQPIEKLVFKTEKLGAGRGGGVINLSLQLRELSWFFQVTFHFKWGLSDSKQNTTI